jgi:hypothetical protein
VAWTTVAGRAEAAAAPPPTVHRRTLANGVRVCYLHVKGSEHFSMFTFLPMGLASDDAGHAQWAHLVEHLVIRTTTPGQLTSVNAETLADHMRLDYYGGRADWRDGLDHHVRWLSGLPFTEESVRVEPGRANGETEYAVRELATHKFAAAAWGQVVRHGAGHAAVKGDITGAGRAALEAYRDERLVGSGPVLVCAIGGVEPAEFLAAAGDALAGVNGAGPAKGKAAAGPAPKPAGERRATWDLAGRHVLLTWPIPSPARDPQGYAALSVLGRLLWMELARDADVQSSFGMLLAGTDLRSPEGQYFYVSAARRAGGAMDGRALAGRVDHLLGTLKDLPAEGVRQVGGQLAAEAGVMDPAALGDAMPAGVKPGMVEAQVAINWGTAEYRLGATREAVARALRGVTAGQVRRAAGDYLGAARRTVLELSPEAH